MALALPKLSRLKPKSQEELYGRLLGKERVRGSSEFWNEYNELIKEVSVKDVPLKRSFYETLMGVFEKNPKLAKSKAKLRHYVAATLLKIFKTGFDGDLFHRGEKISAISDGQLTLKVKGTDGAMVDVNFDLTRDVDGINSREYARKYQRMLGKSRRSLMALKVDIGQTVSERLAILKKTNTLYSAMQFLRLKTDFDGRSDLYFQLQNQGYLKSLGDTYSDTAKQNSAMHRWLIDFYSGTLGSSGASRGGRRRGPSGDSDDDRSSYDDVDAPDSLNDSDSTSAPDVTLASAPSGTPRMSKMEKLRMELPGIKIEYDKTDKSYTISLDGWEKGIKKKLTPASGGKWVVEGVAGNFSLKEAVYFAYTVMKTLDRARLLFYFKEPHPFKLKGDELIFVEEPGREHSMMKIPSNLKKHYGTILGQVNALAVEFHKYWKELEKKRTAKKILENKSKPSEPLKPIAPVLPPKPPGPKKKPEKLEPPRKTPSTPRKVPNLKEKPSEVMKLLRKWDKALDNFIYDVSANDPKAIDRFKKFTDFYQRLVNTMQDLESNGKASSALKGFYRYFKSKYLKMKDAVKGNKIEPKKLLVARKWLLDSYLKSVLAKDKYRLSSDRRTVYVKGKRGELAVGRETGKGWKSNTFSYLMTDIRKAASLNHTILRSWEDYSHHHKGRMFKSNKRPFYYAKNNLVFSNGIYLMWLTEFNTNKWTSKVLGRKNFPKGAQGEKMIAEVLKAFNDRYEKREGYRSQIERAEKQSRAIVKYIRDSIQMWSDKPAKLSGILKAQTDNLKILTHNLRVLRGRILAMEKYGTNVDRLKKLAAESQVRIEKLYNYMKKLGFDRAGASVSRKAMDSVGIHMLKTYISRLGFNPKSYEIVSSRLIKIKVAGMPELQLVRTTSDSWEIKGVYTGVHSGEKVKTADGSSGIYRGGFTKVIPLQQAMYISINMMKNLKQNWKASMESGYGLGKGKKHPIYLDGKAIRLATSWSWTNPAILDFDKAPLAGANYNGLRDVLQKSLLKWLRAEYRKYKTDPKKYATAGDKRSPSSTTPPVKKKPLKKAPNAGRKAPKRRLPARTKGALLNRLKTKLNSLPDNTQFGSGDVVSWKTAAPSSWWNRYIPFKGQPSALARTSVNAQVSNSLSKSEYQQMMKSLKLDRAMVERAIKRHMLNFIKRKALNSGLTAAKGVTKKYATQTLKKKLMLLDEKMNLVAKKFGIRPDQALDLYAKYIKWSGIRTQAKLEEFMYLKLPAIEKSLNSFVGFAWTVR